MENANEADEFILVQVKNMQHENKLLCLFTGKETHKKREREDRDMSTTVLHASQSSAPASQFQSSQLSGRNAFT